MVVHLPVSAVQRKWARHGVCPAVVTRLRDEGALLPRRPLGVLPPLQLLRQSNHKLHAGPTVPVLQILRVLRTHLSLRMNHVEGCTASQMLRKGQHVTVAS